MKKLNVLLVEDDADFAESLAEILEAEGCQVMVAGSAEEAMKRFPDAEFDLSFVDVRLPGMNGVDYLSQVHEQRPGAKIVMMTAFTAEKLLSRAMDEGALSVLQKPFEVEQLVGLLQAACKTPVVLVADDNADFVESMRDLLANAGYSVEVAGTGQEAVDRVVAGGVDVMLLDLRMPLLSGLEVYRRLKRKKRSVPTLVVTGYAKEEAVQLEKLKRRAVRQYLEKPVQPADLIAAIESVLVARAGSLSFRRMVMQNRPVAGVNPASLINS